MLIAVICGLIVVIAVFGLINSLNKNKAIDTNPEYATEKEIKDFLGTFTTRLHIARKPRRSYENGNAYYAAFRKNGEYFAQLLDKGAKMVFVSGSNPDHPQNSPIHIYALTPKMILHKEDHYLYSDKEKDIVTSQKASLATIYTHKFEVFSHGTKNASVAGRAAAGAVLGGAAGAAVGAASAASVNAKGGKVVTTGSEMKCSIRFMDKALDCIIISKEITDKFGAPENVKIEPDATKDYYMYTSNFVSDISAYEQYKSLSDYVYKLITEMVK